MRDDDLCHRLGFHGVPQFDDRESGQTAGGQALQLGDQVFAQRATGTVIDERGIAVRQLARGVAHQAPQGAFGRCGQVMVEDDAAGDGSQEAVDDFLAGVAVEPADDHDRQSGLVPHQFTSRRP